MTSILLSSAVGFAALGPLGLCYIDPANDPRNRA
jgi:hypothetical protein